MPVPGYPLATNKANSTTSATNHPDHHNAVANAVNYLSPKVDALESADTTFDSRADSLEAANTAMDTRVDSLENTVATLQPVAGQFFVRTYGAVGDNATNDRAAIQACLDAAVTYALAHDYYAEVIFDPKTYFIGNAAPTPRSGTNSNGAAWASYAMVALPDVPQNGRKATIKLKGSDGADSMLHWLSSAPQRTGAVLRTTATGLSLQTINGISGMAPAMIGGPIYGAGASNQWSNFHAIIDGLELMAPDNPGIIGIDLKRIANATIKYAGTFAESTVGGQGGNPDIAGPNNGLGIGLRMPEANNNDLCRIESFSCEGFTVGMQVNEHTQCNRAALIYCDTAVLITGPGNYVHGITIQNLSIEASNRCIEVGDTTDFHIPIFVAGLHEETSGPVVVDPGGHMQGVIHWHSIATTQPVVTGGANVKVINERVGPGAPTSPPAVPASGAVVTPFWRDAHVCIAPGAATITAVEIAGAVQATTQGGFTVPSGRTIKLTYTGGTPTWSWTLL